LWRADGDKLTPQSPVTLTWDNGQGLTFTRRIALDSHFMFTITDSIANTGPMRYIYARSCAARRPTPARSTSCMTFVGVLGSTLKETSWIGQGGRQACGRNLCLHRGCQDHGQVLGMPAALRQEITSHFFCGPRATSIRPTMPATPKLAAIRDDGTAAVRGAKVVES
jgi:hypothetical protein